MYKIYINGTTEVQGDGKFVISPVLSETVGCAGSLTYTIPYNDEHYSEYQERSTPVSIYEDESEDPLWRGHLLTTEKDFYNNMELTFEGDMAYLNDIQYPPYEFSGDITEFLTNILNYYNGKCTSGREIQIGSVTVTDSNGTIARSCQEYTSCWKVISDKLVNECGGYLRMRHLDGVRYLDYLTDPGVHNTQQIQFGKNLLDLENYIDATELATVIIPQGAELQAEDGTSLGRVTIEKAADNTTGLSYIETTFISDYGRIETVVQWDDVTLADNLYKKALAYSQTMAEKATTITVKVVDLHLTDSEIDAYNVGDYIDCVSDPHGLTLTLMLSQRTRSLNDPASDTITLGNTQQTYTESMSNFTRKAEEETQTQKVYNANLAQRIQSAKGMYTTVQTDDDGKTILWAHDKPTLADSQLVLNFSDSGIHMSGDGGATWWGQDFNGEFLARLVNAYQISADHIYGGTLSSIAKDTSGQPVTYIDMDSGEVAKLGNIGWIKRDSGNESLKWMGDE